ncbi:FMN-dependent NADH-azoreductase [Hydrogenophaga sp.]|uniref:FMN-dependent NADH-azoreductase n=1 Tax=Hydrogenophaga sp. TaxID=1904254 RepID=UPI0035627A36
MSKTLLHIESSAQVAQRSITRDLGARFMAEWQAAHPDSRVIRRDLATDPVAPVDAEWIGAAFTRPDERTAAMAQRLALSDLLIAEIEAADVIVMGVPMYNYGVPGALKCWIDQTARIGKTFSFDLARGDVPIEATLSGKTLVVLSSRGEFGFAPGGMREHMNALDRHLAACAHYWGVAASDIRSVVVEYQEFKDARFEASVASAKTQVVDLARVLAAGG